MEKLIIDTKLLTLNEYVNYERSNKFGAAARKKKEENKIIILIKEQKFKQLLNIEYHVIIEWYNYREDADNVEFARKFIFDAMQKAKIILNDSKSIIKNNFNIHKKNNLKRKYQILYFFESKNEFIKYLNNNL